MDEEEKQSKRRIGRKDGPQPKEECQMQYNAIQYNKYRGGT